MENLICQFKIYSSFHTLGFDGPFSGPLKVCGRRVSFFPKAYNPGVIEKQ